jgi:hypothetical protein
MLATLGFCLFALVVIFGTPDSAPLTSEAKVKPPFAESEIAFLGFLIAAPALLIVLIIYLHIFDTSRRELENAYKVSSVPALFTLNRPLPNLLTGIIFFWLVPVVLAALTWKALAQLEWALPLLGVTIVVTGGLVWMQIRRRPSNRRFLKNLPLWLVLVGLVLVASFALWHNDTFHRPLNLFRANLAGKSLVGAYLRGANLLEANLQGADLRGAQLQGAYLRGANLQGAKNLRLAQLQGSILFEANLQGADLRVRSFRARTCFGPSFRARI